MTSTTAQLRVTRDQLDKLCRGDDRLRRQFELLFSLMNEVIAGGGGGAPSGPAGGDLTGTYPNPTIATSAVTNAKMADMTGPTFKGRLSGTGAPQDLTGTQATTMLDEFTSGLKGLAPASGGGTSNFLRADGTWAAPASGGGTFGQATATFAGNQSAVTVSVVDAGVSAGSNIVLSVDMGSRAADEFEMAPVLPVVGTITAGVGFTILVACPGLDAVGDYLINYTRD